MPMQIRKFILLTEDVLEEGGRPLPQPRRRAIAACVLKNPFAGHFEQDLTPLIDAGEALGAELVERALAAMGGEADSYGKAAIVGEGGELEHAAALLHPKMGTPVRAALGGGGGADPLGQEAGGAGGHHRHPAGPQGCGLRPQPFRRHRTARDGRADGGGNPAGAGFVQGRPALAAHRRAERGGDRRP